MVDQDISAEDFLKGTKPVKQTAPVVPVETPQDDPKTSPYSKAPWYSIYKGLKDSDAKIPMSDAPIDASKRDRYFAIAAKKQYDASNANSVTSTFDNSIQKQGGWGLSPETRAFLADDTPASQESYLGNVTRPIRNLPANILDLGYRAVQGLNAGIETGAVGTDSLLDKTGIPDLTQQYLGFKLHPGEGVMSLMEAFPDAGLSNGFVAPKGDILPPEIRDHLNQQASELFQSGATKEQMNAWAKQNKMQPWGKELDDAIKIRDADKPPEAAPEAPINSVTEELPPDQPAADLSKVKTAEDLDAQLKGTKPEQALPEVDDLPARQKRATLAEKLGYTPEEFEALPAVGTLDSTSLERGVQLVDQANTNITSLLDKAEKGDLSEGELADLVGEISKFKAVNERLTTGISEGARILDVAAARDKGPKALGQLLEGTSIKSAEDARLLAQRLRALNDSPEARRKLLNAVIDPRAEDYALSLWYNALLSHPATHMTNMMGNALHTGLEGFNKGVAALIGQVGRKADRVYGREVAGNMYGILKSFTSLKTYQEAEDAFFQRGDTKGKAAKAILPGPLTVLEAPSRALNAEDQLWSSMSKMSSVYGQAAKIAAQEGKGYGKEFYKRVGELVDNTTKDNLSKADEKLKQRMLGRAQSTSDFLTFRDDPSKFAKTIEDFRSRRQSDTIGTRVLKTGSRLFVPFVQTPDRLTAATIRNSPLSLVRPSTLGKIVKGGEEGNRTLARVMTGSALTSYLVYLADKGALTGSASDSYAKAGEQQSGDFQPNSVKIDGKLVSVKGIDPFSTQAIVVADLVKRYKNGELSDDGYVNGIRKVIATVGNGLSDNTYTGNIATFIQMFDPSYKGQEAVNSIIPNIASTLTTPAFVKGIDQYTDPTVRDTTGDGSLGDRVVGKIKAGWPGLSDTLPAKHDVYGRPVQKPPTVAGPLTRMSIKEPDQDPTVQELQRLSGLLGNDKVLVSPVKRSDLKNFSATASQLQQYQKLSGSYILESVRQLQESGEWDKMSDAERLKEVQGISRDMRANAREQLFPKYYGPEADPASAVTPGQSKLTVAEFNSAKEDNIKASTFANSVAAQVLTNKLGLHVTDSGVRSLKDQEHYFETTNGSAIPGTSPHEFGKAIDVEVPKNVSVGDIVRTLRSNGYKGVKVVTRRHGTGPHWHIQWDSTE